MGLAVVYKVTIPLSDISFMLPTPTPSLIMKHFFLLQNMFFITEIDTLQRKTFNSHSIAVSERLLLHYEQR